MNFNAISGYAKDNRIKCIKLFDVVSKVFSFLGATRCVVSRVKIDNELLGRVVKNTDAIADNTETIKSNVQVIAKNTKSIVTVLDRELNELNGRLQDIANNTKLAGQQTEDQLRKLNEYTKAQTNKLQQIGESINNVRTAIEGLDLDVDMTGVEGKLEIHYIICR